MNQTITLTTHLMLAGAVLAPAQKSSSLPLQPGAYVMAGTPCKDAPFAALRTWDGTGLGGAHESKCITHVLGRRGATYRVDTVCTAEGDGTPTTPSHERARIVVTGDRSFTFNPAAAGAGSNATAFRWCGAKPE